MKTKFFLLFILLMSSLLAQIEPKLITFFEGRADSNMFGIVTNTGDLNGDGFDDFAIGTNNSNYVNIYFGGATLDTYPDLVLNGEEHSKNFGCKLAGAGDVNNDGYDDLLIVDETYSFDIGFQYGKIYLYLGAAQMDTIPDLTFTSNQFNALLGSSITSNFDFNNDGYKDFAASSYYNNEDQYGKVYLFLGKETMEETPDAVFVSEYISDGFGYSIQGLDDINGDGYDDLAIATSKKVPSHDNHQVLFFYGGKSIDLTPDKIINKGDIRYGEIIYRGGDFNNDGFNEFVLEEEDSVYGSYLIMHTINNNYMIFNSDNLGNEGYYQFSSGEDLNHDGYDDFIIRNFAYNTPEGKSVGKVMLFYGGDIIDISSYIDIIDTTEYNSFGTQAALLGDINGDGFGEFIIGAVQHTKTNWKGRAYLYSLGSITDVERRNINKSKILLGTYPNPFNSSISLKYFLPFSGDVTIDIFNSNGKLIKSLLSKNQQSGNHIAIWKGDNNRNEVCASGVYFVRFSHTSGVYNQENHISKKIILLK